MTAAQPTETTAVEQTALTASAAQYQFLLKYPLFQKAPIRWHAHNDGRFDASVHYRHEQTEELVGYLASCLHAEKISTHYMKNTSTGLPVIQYEGWGQFNGARVRILGHRAADPYEVFVQDHGDDPHFWSASERVEYQQLAESMRLAAAA